MGGSVSVSVGSSHDELLKFIRGLDAPEEALLSEQALSMVRVPFPRIGPGHAGNFGGASTVVIEDPATDIPPGDDPDQDEEEDAAEKKAESGAAEDEIKYSKMLGKLSGRKQSVAPLLYGYLLFIRRMVVLDHVRQVLLERKSRPGDDAFFADGGDRSAMMSPSSSSSQLHSKVVLIDGNDIDVEWTGGSDVAVAILEKVCGSALDTLKQLGGGVEEPVVSSLHSTMIDIFDTMDICSLNSSSLDGTMHFLLECYDASQSVDALEALCILATGRGSVHYLLQVALRMLRKEELVVQLQHTLGKFTSKCAALSARQYEDAIEQVSRELHRKILTFDITGNALLDNESTGAEDEVEVDVEKEVSSSILGFFLTSPIMLGSEPAESGKEPEGNNEVVLLDESMENLSAFPLLERFLCNTKVKVAQISCGRGHVLVRSEVGAVFASGENNFGQCGIQSNQLLPDLVEIEFFQDNPVRRVAAGGEHSLFLTNTDGKVFACGNNRFGQLGLGHNLMHSSPTLVTMEGAGTVQLIAAGGQHSAFVMADTNVYGCGRISGRISNSPLLLFCCESTTARVVDLASGPNYCVALEESFVESQHGVIPSGKSKEGATARRKKRRKKAQFKVTQCLVEHSSQSVAEAIVYHAQHTISLLANKDQILVLADEEAKTPPTAIGTERTGDRSSFVTAPEPSSGPACVLWGLQQIPCALPKERSQVSQSLLDILQMVPSEGTLVIPALRVLQRHCFTQGNTKDGAHAMMNLKSTLFAMAKSGNLDIKEEAIRSIGNGFAFLSPTATELATFMSTITNMTYLSRFATFKFWSELLAQDDQETAFILIDRLIDVASNGKSQAEVQNLLMAMQRSLIVSDAVESEVVNKYASSLAVASAQLVRNFRSSQDLKQNAQSLDASIVKTLMWPCLVMLQHPSIQLGTASDDLLLLLSEIDLANLACMTIEHNGGEDRDLNGPPFRLAWLVDMEWLLVFLLINKHCIAKTFSDSGHGDLEMSGHAGLSVLVPSVALAAVQNGPRHANPKSPVLALASPVLSKNGRPGLFPPKSLGLAAPPPVPFLNMKPTGQTHVNTNLFHSGFCEPEAYAERIRRFQTIVSDSEHEVMKSISKMNKLKFRNKAGEAQVWRAFRAVFAAIKVFDSANEKMDAPQTAAKVLRWLNMTKQAMGDVEYQELALHMEERVTFLLQMINISDHSLLDFVQQYDANKLEAYRMELARQKEVALVQLKGFEVFEKLVRSVKMIDVRRHIIFSLTDYAALIKSTPSIQVLLEKTISALIDTSTGDPELAMNSSLQTAVLDACVTTNNLDKVKLVPWTLSSIQFDTNLKALQNSMDSTPEDPSLGQENTDRDKGSLITSPKKVGNESIQGISRDTNSLSFFPNPVGLPNNHAIQWSREHKHPRLKLSRDGLCLHLPSDLTKTECHTAASIRLSHTLHSGKFYLQVRCTPDPSSSAKYVLYAIGLVPHTYAEWDGFTNITACTLSAEQDIGLYVDMDAGISLAFRHQDAFYKDANQCHLTAEALISRHKLPFSDRPLCPVMSLLSGGTTALLERVWLGHSACDKITLDSAIDLSSILELEAPQSGAVPGTPRTSETGLHDHDDINNANGSLNQASEPGSEDVNPEQDVEEGSAELDEGGINISGPLNSMQSDEPELLVCGQNSYGELGLGHCKPQREVQVSEFSRGLFAVQVVAGNEVTGVLTSQGEVFVWGYNKNGVCGAIESNVEAHAQDSGHSSFGNNKPAQASSPTSSKSWAEDKSQPSSPSLPPPPAVSSGAVLTHPAPADTSNTGAKVLWQKQVHVPTFVTRLACGNGSEHMLAIGSTGHLYGWGFNQYGQLGLGHKFERIVHPTRVKGQLRDKRVTLAATSYGHSLALTSDGTVFGFGLNTRGQLGVGSTADIWTLPQMLSTLAEVGRVTSMSCGVEHSAVVLEDGSLYTFGRNDCGQLGIDDFSKQLSSTPIRVADGLSKLRSLRCEAVACGYYFTVVIANGTLHAFGANDFGQLGVGHNHEAYAPVPVLWSDEDDRFVAVSCGTGHSVAATSYGRLIAWGRNLDGALGNGSTIDHPFPVEICNKGENALSLRDQRPIHLAAGFHHTCILVGKQQKSHSRGSGATFPNVGANGRLSWPMRAVKSSLLALAHVVTTQATSDSVANYALDWMFQRISELTNQVQKPDEIGACQKLCPRHNAADISMCCLEERRDNSLMGWVEGMLRTGCCEASLYLITMLGVTFDVVSKREGCCSFLQEKRSWVVRLLLKLGFIPGSAVRSSLAFDVIAAVLPGIPIADIASDLSLYELLCYIGRGENLQIAAQVISLLRTLLGSEQNGWSTCVNRVLLYSLTNQIPRLAEDVEDLSIFEENQERLWAMLGALQVLGASDEVLHAGAPVAVMSSDADSQEGTLDWFRPHGGFADMARVSLSSSTALIVQKLSQLAPRSKIAVPISRLSRPDRVLSLLVCLVQQSVSLPGSSPGLQNAKAACIHEIAKARASRVIDVLLHNQPGMVQIFVSQGHLRAVTSLLAAPRGRLHDVPLRTLQRRFLQLTAQRITVEGLPNARSVLNRFTERRISSECIESTNSHWICLTCTHRNSEVTKSCQLCQARGTALKSRRASAPYEDLRHALDATVEEGQIKPFVLGSTIRSADLGTPSDQLACTWSFEGGVLPDNKKNTVQLVSDSVPGEPAECDEHDEHDGLDDLEVLNGLPSKEFLLVQRNAHLRFEHNFSGNGSQDQVYINQYSLIIDVMVPASTLGRNDFVALLQTSASNDSLADWYIKGNGSIGCIEYSAPECIKPNQWHRLVMTTDLTNGRISFFVDGEKKAALVHHNPGKHILVLEDDRWALDRSFCLFRDVEMKDQPSVYVANVQLRAYVMTEGEVDRLGPFQSDQALPLPDVLELSNRLSNDLRLPKAWCVRALQATQHSLPRARHWLRSNEQALIARTVAEARMLTALGYTSKLCAHAICTTSSLSDAIHWLLNNEGVDEREVEVSRIMQECTRDDAESLSTHDMLAINLAEDDQDAHNRTYEINATTDGSSEGHGAGPHHPGNDGDIVPFSSRSQIAMTSEPGGAPAVTTGAHRPNSPSLPPLGCGARQINAELWETARQLFVSHARSATVSILENSLIVRSSNLSHGMPLATQKKQDDNMVRDMQQKLLAMDGTGRNFLRNYLRAFPDSISRDIHSSEASIEIESSDPIQVLRRKLLLVFSQEVQQKSVPKLTGALEEHPEALTLYLDLNNIASIALKEGSKPKVEVGQSIWYVDRARLKEAVAADRKGENSDKVQPSLRQTILQAKEGEASKLVQKARVDSIIEEQDLKTAHGGEVEDFQQLAKVLFDFQPQRGGDLAIRKGDTVIVLGATRTGWGRARDLKTGVVGTIPLNYVDAIGEESATERSPRKDRDSRPAPRTQHIILKLEASKTEITVKGYESLLAAPPPAKVNDLEIRKALKNQADEQAWRNSVLRSLSEDVLHELILLARGPWQFLPGGLQAGPSVQFQEIWSDRFTRTFEQMDPITKKKKETSTERQPTIRVWRPFADSGFSILGDVCTIGNDEKPPPVTVVSDDDGMGGKTTTSNGLPLLVPPAGFKLVWQDLEADNDSHVSFWQPIPPDGYVALGCVAIRGHSRKEPALRRDGLEQLRCVHQSCVQLSTLHHGLWSFRPDHDKRVDEGEKNSHKSSSVFASEDDEKKGSPPAAAQRERGSFGVKGGFSRLKAVKPSGVSIWEIDNSSRTFVPVLMKDTGLGDSDGIGHARERQREVSRLLSMNRVDAGTIEARLCIESNKKSSEEALKSRMLHGLRLTSGTMVPPSSTESDVRKSPVLDGMGGKEAIEGSQVAPGELRPHHLGLASTTSSNRGSSDLLLWILQLFSEFDANEAKGMGRWAKRVFSPQLVHALLRFSRTASPSVRIKAIRMLAMVIRRTPADSLRGKLGNELLELRNQMETLYTRQAQKTKEGVTDEMPLFSSLLCALAEVFVSVSLTQRQFDSKVHFPKIEIPAEAQNKTLAIESAGNEREFYEVAFTGLLGIEILSNKDVLIVHSVKEEGAAFNQGVVSGDIFWELNGKRVADYDWHELWKTIKSVRPLRVVFLRDGFVSHCAANRDTGESEMEPPGEKEIAGSEASDETVTSHENWFQQLAELAAIMEALVHRDRVRMPSDFLMAEDTFLKLVLANHTAVVESEHPFSDKAIKGHVTIPGAEALVVRFDRRCSTPFGKTLQLKFDTETSPGEAPREFVAEVLQGCYGSCSVHIPSSTMNYAFPVPQAMSWGFHRTNDFKAPEIRVSNNGHTVSLRKDKVWQTVFATTGFCSGINMWEVRVDRTGPSANIFFGVAMKSAKVTNYLGSDDKGWGWIGCMACWHGGRKVRHKFGKRLKHGDIVRITLDIPRRAMSIACNGEDWGVAFNRLPLPSTVLKPGNELVPTFSFYNKDDQITLLSGSVAMEPSKALVLSNLRSNFEQQHATARIAPRFLGAQSDSGGSSSSSRSSRRRSSRQSTRRSHRESESSSSRRAGRRSSRRPRWSESAGNRLTTTLVDSETGDTSTNAQGASSRTGVDATAQSSIENHEASQSTEEQSPARALSDLGYPIEFCIQALDATGHDMQRAAEYLINHADRMAEESLQEAERAAAEAEEAVLAEEEEWLSQVNLILDQDEHDTLLGRSPSSARSSQSYDDSGVEVAVQAAVSTLQSAAASSQVVQRETAVRGFDPPEDDSTGGSHGNPELLRLMTGKRSPKEKKRTTNKEWGYRMTISPLFSRETTKRIAKEPKNAARLNVFHKMFENLSLEHDCALVRMVNTVCGARNEDPLTLSPNDLEPTADELAKFEILSGIPLLHLQLRFLLLRNFNRRLAHVLPLIDLSCPTHESALAAALRGVRGLVMSSVKKALFERVLADSHSGDDHWMQQNKVPTVTLDRNKAAQFLKTGRVDTKGIKTVFGQLFSQLHGNDSEEQSAKNPLLAPTPAVSDASLLRNSHRAWYTILAGERADDYGGPYRDVFNQACQELLTPTLPLFVPCPNQVSNQGSDRGKWLPAASSTSSLYLNMFEFVGKLMGIAMRTKNPFVLDLPAFVWKQLCNDQVSLADIRKFDLDFYNTYKAVASVVDEEALERLDLKFTMRGSDGETVELVPGGNSMVVNAGRREDYLRALERSRLHELDRQCAAIARGLGTQIPRYLLSIFTAAELELMVCGPPEVDIAVLKLNTIYGDGISENTPSVQLFWQVMESFSQENKQRYLRFVWGRSRLPSSTADWERKHKINKFTKTPSDDYLPVGHTCFFSLDLPLYTSRQICHDKLLFAIMNCVSIDADETTVARQAGEAYIQRGDEEEDDDDDDDEDEDDEDGDGNGDLGRRGPRRLGGSPRQRIGRVGRQ